MDATGPVVRTGGGLVRGQRTAEHGDVVAVFRGNLWDEHRSTRST